MAHAVVMPSLGMFTAEGTLSRWLKPAGATVVAGEPIAEVTTEKAVFEVPAPAAGRLATVAAEGALLAVEGVLGWVLAEGEAAPAAAGAAASAALPVPGAAAPAAVPGEERVKASPAARKLAAAHGIDLARVTASGPGGRIVEADVQAAMAPAGGAAPAASARPVRERLPLAGMRRTIADRLRASLATAASLTLTREVDAAELAAARVRLGERLGLALAHDALFVKVFADALAERSELNAVIEDGAILRLAEVHVGFAVAVPGGLVVPVVRHADREPLKSVAAAVAALAEKARRGQLRAEDVDGGTASISNLGAYGIDAFTPILNPPQSVLLGLGRIAARPVVRDGAVVPGLTVVLSLTFDHRVADGAPAAELLAAVARRMSDPAYLRSLA